MSEQVQTENWDWTQGADLVMPFTYEAGPDGQEVPVDLTGWQLRMDVALDGVRLFTFNSDDIDDPDVDVVGPSDNEATLGNDGSINIVVPRSLTLEGGPVFPHIVPDEVLILDYDIFLRDTTGLQDRICKGTIRVRGSVTKWA